MKMESEGPDAASPGLALAVQLEGDILAQGAAPGTVVASARQLRELSPHGRPVVQQAVRILQERGVAYMRRGAGGGLVVAQPSPAFAARSLSIEFERAADRLEELGPIALAVDTNLYLEGAARASWESLQELRSLADRLDHMPDNDFDLVDGFRQLWRAMRAVEGEPVSLLAEHAVFEFTADNVPFSFRRAQFVRNSPAWRNQMDLVDAIASADVERMFSCRAKIAAMFDARHEWLEAARDPNNAPVIGDAPIPPFHGVRNRADSLVREIIRQIRELGWRPGARISSGVELMERYHVGADIVRQAILLLQQHGAVSVEKGRKGGLYVAGSNRDAALKSAAAYLARTHASADRARSFLVYLVLETYGGYPAPDIARLRRNAQEVLAARTGGDSPELWTIVAGLCRSSVLDIFIDLLRPMSDREVMDPTAAEMLLRAVASGDYVRGRWLLVRALSGPRDVQAHSHQEV